MNPTHPARRGETQRQGLQLLVAIVVLMRVLEVINSLDNNALDRDGIYPRNFGRLWGILTAPFLHVSFGHLIANTIPFAFMGLIIALRGASRLLLVTAGAVLVRRRGAWLVAPGGAVP